MSAFQPMQMMVRYASRPNANNQNITAFDLKMVNMHPIAKIATQHAKSDKWYKPNSMARYQTWCVYTHTYTRLISEYLSSKNSKDIQHATPTEFSKCIRKRRHTALKDYVSQRNIFVKWNMQTAPHASKCMWTLKQSQSLQFQWERLLQIFESNNIWECQKHLTPPQNKSRQKPQASCIWCGGALRTTNHTYCY